VPETFRASCGQAISKAAKKGRLLKEGALYKLKPGYNYPRVSYQSSFSQLLDSTPLAKKNKSDLVLNLLEDFAAERNYPSPIPVL
jgi:hypothetical protein